MLEPKDEGVTHIQRPRPGEFDVVLGSRTPREPIKSGASGGRMLLYLLVLGIAAWLLTPQLFASKPKVSPPVVPLSTVIEEPPIEPPAGLPAPQSVAQPIDISLPSAPVLSPAPAAAPPQPLDKCLKQGNVIDQRVADCRFGEGSQSDTAGNTGSSMVSAGSSRCSQRSPASASAASSRAAASLPKKLWMLPISCGKLPR